MYLNKLLVIALLTLLSGCNTFGFSFKRSEEKPVEVVTKPAEKLPLALTDPAPLRLKVPRWLIVTPQNVDAIWKSLQDKKVDLVLFALTDDGYEELSVDMAEIRNLISTQRSIVLKYREYYEAPHPKDAVSNK